MKNKKIRIIFLLAVLCVFLIIFLFAVDFKKDDNKTVEVNKKTTKTKEEWYSPKGETSFINLYKNNEKNLILALKENEIEQFSNLEDYSYIGNYKCTLNSCKAFDYDFSNNYIIIKDENYLIFDYEKNLALNLNIPISEYNDIKFMSYEGKVYGLSVSNINDLYAYYSLKEEKFKTGFDYSNIYNFDNASLIENRISASKLKDQDNSTFAYCIIDLDDGKELFQSEVPIGSIGNENEIYYFLNYADVSGYDAIIYNNKFEILLDGKRVQNFSVTEKGNLIIKTQETSFSLFNKNGNLIKNSKEYKNINFIYKDYVLVTDLDNYLKVVDLDGNLIHKFFELNEENLLEVNISKGTNLDKKDTLYISIWDEKQNKEIIYYYVFETRKSGVVN